MNGRRVVVQALKAYDDHPMGDIFLVPMNQATAHLIVSHYLRLLDDPAWRQSESTEPKSA
jgi:hypothetical protein